VRKRRNFILVVHILNLSYNIHSDEKKKFFCDTETIIRIATA